MPEHPVAGRGCRSAQEVAFELLIGSLLSFGRQDPSGDHLGQQLPDLEPIGLGQVHPELLQRDRTRAPLSSGRR